MDDLKGKKLLILGGAYQHRKIVKKAIELGVETYVTDYLEVDQSPAKQLARHKLQINITDIDGLVRLCKNEKIDGVIGPYLDVTQEPYQKLCEIMGYPCFGDANQHKILTNKKEFKKFCIANGADVIPGYTIEEVMDGSVEYPLLIKPTDSRGSRGQSLCHDRDQALRGIEYALSESKAKEVTIEKYMGVRNDTQLVYLVINGEPILYKVEDRYLGPKEEGLDKLCIATVTPSKNEALYREAADCKVKTMIKALGLVNSPVFIQCFMDGKTARLYDPGIRMPGDDYDDAKLLTGGIDIPELLVRFALTGRMDPAVAEKIKQSKENDYIAMILPCLKPGVISGITGMEALKENKNVISFSCAYSEGDEVLPYGNVKQRFGEFVLAAKDKNDLRKTIEWLFDKVHVYNSKGEDMLIAKFNLNLLDSYR